LYPFRDNLLAVLYHTGGEELPVRLLFAI
jgi:hypothetical protein